MSGEDRVVLVVFSAVSSLLSAAPGVLFRHNHSVYERARTELMDPGGPFARMKGLMRAISDRVNKRFTEAVTASAKALEEEIQVDETVQQIIEGSSADLANFNRTRELRDRRRVVTGRVRGLARLLQFYSLAAFPAAAMTGALIYFTADLRFALLPLAYLVVWLLFQGALQVRRWQEDRIADKYAELEGHYLEVD